MKECIVLTYEMKENIASVIGGYEYLDDFENKPEGLQAIMELIDAMGLDLRYDRNIGGKVFCEKD
jgi:hypothetical protein